MKPVPIELLEAAAPKRREPIAASAPTGSFNLERWIAEHSLEVDGPAPWEGGQRWIFHTCPWNEDHRNRSAFIVQRRDGAIAAGCHHNGCKGKDWHALRDLLEPGWRHARHRKTSAIAGYDSTVVDWERPIPFHQFDLPLFPSKGLPAWVRDYVEALATATQTPLDLAAMLALSVIAASCAGKVIIRMKEGYSEPVNIFTVTALPPASRKSQVFAAVTEPLQQYEAAEARRLGPEIERRKTAHKIKESQLKRVQEQAANAASKEQDKLAEAAGKLAAELRAIEVPSEPRFIVSDCTSEKLAVILRQQGGRVAVMSPEGEIFDLMSGRYSATKDGSFEVFLKGHSGDTIRVDRVGRATEFVRRPAVTVGLAVQPDVIHGLVGKQGFRGRGLLGRFWYALPKSLLGRRNTNPPAVPDEVRAAYAENILALLHLRLPAEPDSTPFEIRLDGDARERMHQFENWVEPQLAEFGDLGAMTDWGGKLFGAIGRVTALLHLAKHTGASAPWDIAVTVQTVEDAIAIGRYLIPHAKAAFALMGADAAVENAQAILRWIEHRDLQCVSKRDIHQGMKGTFKRVEDLEKPLDALVRHNYLGPRPEPESAGPGRRPSPIFDVNPLWKRGPASRPEGEF